MSTLHLWSRPTNMMLKLHAGSEDPLALLFSSECDCQNFASELQSHTPEHHEAKQAESPIPNILDPDILEFALTLMLHPDFAQFVQDVEQSLFSMKRNLP